MRFLTTNWTGALVLAGLLLAPACYGPGEPGECSVRCGTGGLCPEGTSCGVDGYCHHPGAGTCSDLGVGVDGGGPGDGGGGDDGGPPSSLGIFAGARATCLLRPDRTAWCAGDNGSGQLGDGSTINRASRVALPGTFAKVSLSTWFSCGVSPEGALLCWGSDYAGRLGNGARGDEPTPHELLAGSRWLDVAAGYEHACAIRDDGSLWCWGANNLGQLGTGAAGAAVDAPTLVTKGPFAAVSATGAVTCALGIDHALFCWGDNQRGQVGNGRGLRDGAFEAAPVRIDGSWRSVSTGGLHVCAVRDDQKLFCWGYDGAGQLGMAGQEQSVPTLATNDGGWVQVACGSEHTVGRKQDGTLWCFGEGWRGQCGNGAVGLSDVPTRIGDASDWTHVVAGDAVTCGVRAGGTAWCWGDNGAGQLGQGTIGDHPRPFHVDDGWSQLSMGDHFTCGIKRDGTLWCWGINQYGQLGVGDYKGRAAPVQAGSGKYSRVAAGQNHVCALDDAGALYCWGNGGNGQTAGAASNVNRPVLADAEGRTWLDVATDSDTSYGVTSDHELYAWGADVHSGPITRTGLTVNGWSAVSGYCGLAGTRLSCALATPDAIEVQAGTTWSTLGSGGYFDLHNCALQLDHSLWCWGTNFAGQLGDGSTTDSPRPVRIGLPRTFRAVAAGNYFTVAVADDGKLLAWGNEGPWLGSPTARGGQPPVEIHADSDFTAVTAGGDGACALKGAAGERWCWGLNNSVGDGYGFFGTPLPMK